MSDARAIAAVTATLQHVVRSAVQNIQGLAQPVEVTALPPDRVVVGENEKPTVNLFLHRVAPNIGWSNIAARQRAGDGARVANPPLSLDLHYLLSAYGAKERHADLLLGHAMLALHATPVVDVATIRTVLADATLGLAGCGLDSQPEAIRVGLAPLSAEDASRLWSALQSRMRPSANYVVTVALLEALRPMQAPLPVKERRLVVMAARAPQIESISPGTAVVGDTLVIRGASFAAEGLRVRFDGVVATPLTVAPDQIEVQVPAGLSAGIAPVQVLRQVDFGSPGDPHAGPESNVASIVLAPKLTTVPATMSRGATASLVVDPPVKAAQKVELLLGQRGIVAEALPPNVDSASSIAVKLPADMPLGQALVRVRVDGVASGLEQDTNPASPTFGQWIGPVTEVVA